MIEQANLLTGRGKKSLWRWIQWAIVISLFFFLGKVIWENWGQVKEAPFTLKPFPLILSIFIFGLSHFVQIWAWYLITVKLGIAISIRETLETWFYSQLGKYLPGKVWLLLGRFYFYRSKGKSKEMISVALYLETATMVMAAGILFLVSLLYFPEMKLDSLRGQFWWVSLPLLLIFISLHPKVLQKVLNGFLVLFKKEPLSLPISYADAFRIILICVLSWVIGGAGFYLFVDSVFPVSYDQALFLTGSLAFSSILGLIAFFAPGGLGVREGALVYLLSFVMPTSVAVIVSVLTRLWTTVIEIGLTGMVYMFHRFRGGIQEKGKNG
ncbi:MAG: flippase-like domain-containing protein [Syntrophaceae bacterium]|nr:flippase-like domain-containing protein [Syntrophaceae bacterium]